MTMAVAAFPVAAFSRVAFAAFVVTVTRLVAVRSTGAFGTGRTAVAFFAMRTAVAEALAVPARVAVMSCTWMHGIFLVVRHGRDWPR